MLRQPEDLQGKVELAVVFVPASQVPGVLEDGAAAGIKAAVIESGGFAETGEEGRELQDRCLRIAREGGMRLWGPNCTGLVNTDPLIFTPFIRFPDLRTRLQRGNPGIIAQTGICLLYTSPSPRDRTRYRMPPSARKKKQ